MISNCDFGSNPRIIPVHHKGKKVAELWLIADFSGPEQWRVRWFRGSQVARHHVDTQVATLNAQLERAPLPPGALVGALQDRIGPTSGRLIASTPIKTNAKTPPQPKP